MRVPGDLVEQLRRARDLIDRDFADESLDLERVAAAAGLSKWHSVRVFAAEYGVTPGAYLSRRRIELAAAEGRTTIALAVPRRGMWGSVGGDTNISLTSTRTSCGSGRTCRRCSGCAIRTGTSYRSCRAPRGTDYSMSTAFVVSS